MKSHTQKKSEITLFENENRKTPYISVNYGRIELRDIIDLRPESLDWHWFGCQSLEFYSPS